MHCLETLWRINAEWPNPSTPVERRASLREFGIRQLEARLGIGIDRSDPMLGAMAQLEMALTEFTRAGGAR